MKTQVGYDHQLIPVNLREMLFGATDSTLFQFLRYVVVGGLAFLVDFASLYGFTEYAGLHYLVSAALAFVLGLVANYLLSRTWVFNKRALRSTPFEFLIFAGIGLVGLGLNEAIMWAAASLLGLYYMTAKLISAAIVLVWNFGARKMALFR